MIYKDLQPILKSARRDSNGIPILEPLKRKEICTSTLKGNHKGNQGDKLMHNKLIIIIVIIKPL